jgi:hypothetical protein
LPQGKAAPAAKGKGVVGKLKEKVSKGEKKPEGTVEASKDAAPADVHVEATAVVA